MRIEQARHLHGQGAPSGDHSPGSEILPGGASDRQRVNAGMLPEPAIFIVDQRLQIARRNISQRYRIAPDALRIGKAPQRRPVFRHHYSGRGNLTQRQRPQPVCRQQQ